MPNSDIHPELRGVARFVPRTPLHGWSGPGGGLAVALQVGTPDLLHDEAPAYAARLRAAGVPCEVRVAPGAFHAFDRLAPKASISRQFFESQCASLDRHMAVA